MYGSNSNSGPVSKKLATVYMLCVQDDSGRDSILDGP